MISGEGWPFAENACNDEGLKSSSVLRGGSNELSVLTAQLLGLTARSMAQLGSSVGLKVISEDLIPYPMPAPSEAEVVDD